jgi:hypothetical protein
MLDQDHVFQRTTLEGTEISAHLYNFIIGLTLLWGFAVNYYMVNNVPIQWILSIGYWPLLIGYIVSVFIGVITFVLTKGLIGLPLLAYPIWILFRKEK